MSEDKGFEIKRTLSKDEQVPGWNTGSKYDPIIKSVNTLQKGETLEIQVDKISQASSIRSKIESTFEHNKFKVMQRSINKGNFCYIKKLN